MTEELKQLQGKRDKAFADVPDGYFESLPEKVTARIQAEKNPVSSVLWQNRYALMAAASLLILLGIVLLIPRMQHENSQPIAETEWMDTTALIADFFHPDNNLANPKLIPEINLPNTDLDPLLALLDEIPLESIIEYLAEVDEFQF
jgi:hypothetical protein